LIIDCLLAVINQEKTIHNIEEFDKSKLKHTETEVKNPLPDKEGEIVLVFCYYCYYYYTVSQKTSHLRLAIVLTYTIRLR